MNKKDPAAVYKKRLKYLLLASVATFIVFNVDLRFFEYGPGTHRPYFGAYQFLFIVLTGIIFLAPRYLKERYPILAGSLVAMSAVLLTVKSIVNFLVYVFTKIGKVSDWSLRITFSLHAVATLLLCTLVLHFYFANRNSESVHIKTAIESVTGYWKSAWDFIRKGEKPQLSLKAAGAQVSIVLIISLVILLNILTPQVGEIEAVAFSGNHSSSSGSSSSTSSGVPYYVKAEVIDMFGIDSSIGGEIISINGRIKKQNSNAFREFWIVDFSYRITANHPVQRFHNKLIVIDI